MNVWDIDIIRFLEDYEIRYSESGKNIGKGWIGIETCPFCEAPNNHFGIRLESNTGSCFVCGETASPLKLIKVLAEVDWGEAKRIARKYLDPDRYVPTPPAPGEEVVMPPHFEELSELAVRYLRERRFDPDWIKRKYGISCTGPSSYLKMGDGKWDFRYRILIPIVMNGRVVSYTARSFVGKDPRYMNCPVSCGIIPASSSIYGIDTIKDGKAIIVEGPTDVWRLGDQTISMMGVKFTDDQVKWLCEKGLKEAFVLFDPGAKGNAEMLGNALGSFVRRVKIVTLKVDKDPGDLSLEEAIRLKYQLLGGL